MPDLLTDEEVGLTEELTDAEVGLGPSRAEPDTMPDYFPERTVSSPIGVPMRIRQPRDIMQSPVELPTAVAPKAEGEVTLSSPIGVPFKVPKQLAEQAGAALYNVAKPVAEFPFSAAGMMMGALPATALGRAAAQGLFAGLAAKSGGEALGEASVTRDTQRALEGGLMLGAAPFMARPGTRVPTIPRWQGPLAKGELLRMAEGAKPSPAAEAVAAVGVPVEGEPTTKLSPAAEAAVSDIIAKAEPVLPKAAEAVEQTAPQAESDLSGAVGRKVIVQKRLTTTSTPHDVTLTVTGVTEAKSRTGKRVLFFEFDDGTSTGVQVEFGKGEKGYTYEEAYDQAVSRMSGRKVETAAPPKAAEAAKAQGVEPAAEPNVITKELSEEGVTPQNIKALLDGTKTPEQVVNEQLKLKKSFGSFDSPYLLIDENPNGTRTASVAPDAGPSRMAPKNIGASMPHDQALAMAIGQGIDRINTILERHGKIPKRLSDEEIFRRTEEQQDRLEAERLKPPAAAPKPEPAPSAKEPWQMTKAEFAESAKKDPVESPALKVEGKIYKAPSHPEALDAAEEALKKTVEPGASLWVTKSGRILSHQAGIDWAAASRGDVSGHKAMIKRALDRGQSVPPEVLADYPDLKPSEPAPSAAPATTLEEVNARLAQIDAELKDINKGFVTGKVAEQARAPLKHEQTRLQVQKQLFEKKAPTPSPPAASAKVEAPPPSDVWINAGYTKPTAKSAALIERYIESSEGHPGGTLIPWHIKLTDEGMRLAGRDNPYITKATDLHAVAKAITEAERSLTVPIPKVAAEVQNVARTEGQRSAKEVKSELVTRLEKAVEDAPEESPEVTKARSEFDKAISTGRRGAADAAQQEIQRLLTNAGIRKVEIDIPGDGKFSIWNTKFALQSVLDSAKRISTKPTEPTKIQYTGASKADREWIEQQLKQQPPTPPPAEPGMAGPGTGIGPGSAHQTDQPAAPRQARAAGAAVEQAPPEARPLGAVSTVSVGLNNVRQAIKNIGTTLKGIAGHTMPKTTAANRLAGEAGARYLSSRIAARPLAATFSARVLENTNVDPIKLGAALTEDNLRSIRESMRAQVTELMSEGKHEEAADMARQADNVATIIGSKNSPFPTEDAYFDFLADPATKKAIGQHLQLWQEIIDPQYRDAQSIDPDVELPSRGQQTGARINLKAVLPDQPATIPVLGSSASLTATFKKKSPFGVKARGTGQAYDVDYHSIIRNTFERQLEIANKNAFDKMLVQNGLAAIDKPGRSVQIGNKATVAFPLQRRIIVSGKKGEKTAFSQAQNIYVRSDLADEYRSAANVDRKFRWPVITPVMDLLNRAALAGLTDGTVHISNQMTALFNRPVSGKFWTDTLLSATGRADVPVTLARAVMKSFKDNAAQVSELSEIGAMRPQGDIHYGVFGRVLQRTDRITRLLLDDTFKELVRQGLVPNTETARREYVNQIGQYNRRAQGLFTRFARDVGFGPFVTAGKTFNSLGVKMATLSPGAPAANAYAAAALRANVLSKWVGGAVLVGALNYLITGKMLGRAGTKIGDIDTGKNDKSGKQLSLPLLSLLGLGRGLRVTGLAGAINAKRMGLSDSDAIDAATRDIINSWTAPYAGPPVKFGAIAATGYQPAVNIGRASRIVPPGESQFNQNVGDAIRQSSPVIQTYIKAREGKSVPEILATQIPRFTMQPGKTESMVENYPRIVSMAQGAAFINDMIHEARRMDPDKRIEFVVEQVKRLPIEQQAHALREAHRRKVYQ